MKAKHVYNVAKRAECAFKWYGFTIQKGFIFGHDDDGYFVSSGARSRRDNRAVLVYRQRKGGVCDYNRNGEWYSRFEWIENGNSTIKMFPWNNRPIYNGNAAAAITMLVYGTLPSYHDAKPRKIEPKRIPLFDWSDMLPTR